MSPVSVNPATSVKAGGNLRQHRHPGLFVHPAEALHGDLGMLDSRDVMLFISYSGSAKSWISSCRGWKKKAFRCWR